MRTVLRRATFAVALVILMLLAPHEAGAGQRMVTVNGVVLGPQELPIADANAGFLLPDGHYWYDAASGYWGAVGGPALGRVAPQAQPGWSWRDDSAGSGMIYDPDGSSSQEPVWIDPDSDAPEPERGHLRQKPRQHDPQQEDWAGLRTFE